MTDYFGRDIKVGDLVVIADGTLLNIGIVKKCNNHQFHFYYLGEFGINQSKKLLSISFIVNTHNERFLKIDPGMLNELNRKYYDAIMLNIKGNVTSTNNT